MHSEKQKLQKARAYIKFVLTGLLKPINTDFLTLEEYNSWQKIKEERQKLLDAHDDNSRRLGLKVPTERCFICRKQADRIVYNDTYVCSKCITNEELGDCPPIKPKL